MTYTQMISLLPDKSSPVDMVGRAFFSAQTSVADRRKLLDFLLEENRFEQIFGIVNCSCINGNINMNNSSADYVAASGGKTDINTRYFSLFVQIANECGIPEERFVPLMYAAATADKNNVLRAWQTSAQRFLTKLARADYDSVWNFLRANDPDFKMVFVLLDVDKERALAGLTELALFGRGINKVALRNVLRGYTKEVFSFVKPIYASLKTADRVTAVRLLLSFKNDPEVLDFLTAVYETEKSKSVRELLESNIMARQRTVSGTDKLKVIGVFYDAMIRGTSVTATEFLNERIFPPYNEVADSLFFSVYKNGYMQDIVIVDKGRVLDLNNDPYHMSENCEVCVLHPVELTSATEYLRRLDIEQPFPQIKRKTYFATGEDKRSNGCFGMAGTVIGAKNFKAGMKRWGFKILNKNADGICNYVGLLRDGILCVVFIAPIDFSSVGDEYAVQAQGVRFYDEKDVIRLGGQQFVEAVTPYPIAHLSPRVFSEFLYAVYDLMGCQ